MSPFQDEMYLSTFFNLTLPISFSTSVMEGTEVARAIFSLGVALVDFKLFDCSDSAKDNFLIGVASSFPINEGGGGGGGGGGSSKPIDIGGGGGGGGGPITENGGGGGGGIGVGGMLP